jgi:hypothetical protein
MAFKGLTYTVILINDSQAPPAAGGPAANPPEGPSNRTNSVKFEARKVKFLFAECVKFI